MMIHSGPVWVRFFVRSEEVRGAPQGKWTQRPAKLPGWRRHKFALQGFQRLSRHALQIHRDPRIFRRSGCTGSLALDINPHFYRSPQTKKDF